MHCQLKTRPFICSCAWGSNKYWNPTSSIAFLLLTILQCLKPQQGEAVCSWIWRQWITLSKIDVTDGKNDNTFKHLFYSSSTFIAEKLKEKKTFRPRGSSSVLLKWNGANRKLGRGNTLLIRCMGGSSKCDMLSFEWSIVLSWFKDLCCTCCAYQMRFT